MKPEVEIRPINKTIAFNPLKEPPWKDAEWNFKGNHDIDYNPVDDPAAIQEFLNANYPLPTRIRKLALPVFASLSALSNSIAENTNLHVYNIVQKQPKIPSFISNLYSRLRSF